VHSRFASRFWSSALGWGALSLGIHLVAVVLLWPVSRSAPAPEPQFVDLVERDSPDSSDPRRAPASEAEVSGRVPLGEARLGDPWAPAGDRPADTLRSGAGALGEGRPRPSSSLLAGGDLDDLRFSPYSHPERDTALRAQIGASGVDGARLGEGEPTPFLTTGAGTVPQRRTRATLPVESGRPATTPGVAPLDPRAPAGPQAGDGAAAEVLSRLPKDGEEGIAPVDASGQRRWSGGGGRGPRDHRQRELSSTRRFPDVLDMGRAAGNGRSTGAGRGSIAGRRGVPWGGPRGSALWLNTPDARYTDYFRRIYRKVDPLWVFPKRLEIQMEQGDVLVEFTILSDGGVRDVRVRRSSGYDQFDRNVLAAIRKAAPFGPIPDGLGSRLRVVAPFEFANPMVR
jgi:TonB family protein